MWRNLLRGLGRRRARRAVVVADQGERDACASAGRPSRPSSPVLSQIEQTALAIYAAHGLPTRPGHYRRARRARRWTFLGETLTPEARWAAMLDGPPEDGWRYASLADIGRGGPPEVRAAADLLRGCALLRDRLSTAGVTIPQDDIELAIRVGADWRALAHGQGDVSGARLQRTLPDDPATVEARPPVVRRLQRPKPRS